MDRDVTRIAKHLLAKVSRFDSGARKPFLLPPKPLMTRRKKRRRQLRKPDCLMPGCTEPSHCRGLCLSHYQRTRRLIAAGEFTEEELIEAGAIQRPHANNGEHDKWLLDLLARRGQFARDANAEAARNAQATA